MTGVDAGCNAGIGVGTVAGVKVAAVMAGEIVAEGIDVDAGYTVGEGNSVAAGTEAGTGSGDGVAALSSPADVEFFITIVLAGAFETLAAGPYVP